MSMHKEPVADDAEETNMRRWTDGRRWGASRVGGGGFLVYTE